MEPSSKNRWARVELAAYCLTSAALVWVASNRLRGLLLNTTMLALGAVALAAPFGTALGIMLAKIELPGRRVVAMFLVSMLFVPLYVQAAAWNSLLGAGGLLAQALASGGYATPWLEGWQAAIWMHAMGAVPWFALMTAASLRTVERRLEEESLLDATPARVLLRVSLRRGLGGVLAAAVWTAVICATEIAVTDLYQLRTFAEEIYTQASLGSLADSPETLWATDLAVGVSLIALATLLALRLVLPWLPVAASIAGDAVWSWRPTFGKWALATAMWGLAAFILAIPLIGLLWKAGIEVHQRADGYERSWSIVKAAAMVLRSPWEHRREWGWSLAIGSLAAAGATVVGILIAWSARVRPRVARPLAVAIALAMAVPAPLLGVWTIQLFNHAASSLWAPLTILYDRTLAAPVLLQFLRSLPLVALWLWSQFAHLPNDLLEAARSEGAGPVAQLFRVALPSRLPGVAAAALLALVISIGEISATLLVLPPGVTTISVRVFQLLHYGVDDRLAALSLSIFVVLGLGMPPLLLAGKSLLRPPARVPGESVR